MAGYNGYSMSNNATDAYNNGEMPLSKWKKSYILDEIENVLAQHKSVELLENFKKMNLSDLKEFLTCSSWHHTSCKYNKTDFYKLDEDRIENYASNTQEKNYVYKNKDGFYLSNVKNDEGFYRTFEKSEARHMTIYEAMDYVKFVGEYEEV